MAETSTGNLIFGGDTPPDDSARPEIDALGSSLIQGTSTAEDITQWVGDMLVMRRDFPEEFAAWENTNPEMGIRFNARVGNGDYDERRFQATGEFGSLQRFDTTPNIFDSAESKKRAEELAVFITQRDGDSFGGKQSIAFNFNQFNDVQKNYGEHDFWKIGTPQKADGGLLEDPWQLVPIATRVALAVGFGAAGGSLVGGLFTPAVGGGLTTAGTIGTGVGAGLGSTLATQGLNEEFDLTGLLEGGLKGGFTAAAGLVLKDIMEALGVTDTLTTEGPNIPVEGVTEGINQLDGFGNSIVTAITENPEVIQELESGGISVTTILDYINQVRDEVQRQEVRESTTDDELNVDPANPDEVTDPEEVDDLGTELVRPPEEDWTQPWVGNTPVPHPEGGRWVRDSSSVSGWKVVPVEEVVEVEDEDGGGGGGGATPTAAEVAARDAILKNESAGTATPEMKAWLKRYRAGETVFGPVAADEIQEIIPSTTTELEDVSGGQDFFKVENGVVFVKDLLTNTWVVDTNDLGSRAGIDPAVDGTYNDVGELTSGTPIDEDVETTPLIFGGAATVVPPTVTPTPVTRTPTATEEANRDFMLTREAEGTATPAMIAWLERFRAGETVFGGGTAPVVATPPSSLIFGGLPAGHPLTPGVGESPTVSEIPSTTDTESTTGNLIFGGDTGPAPGDVTDTGDATDGTAGTDGTGDGTDGTGIDGTGDGTDGEGDGTNGTGDGTDGTGTGDGGIGSGLFAGLPERTPIELFDYTQLSPTARALLIPSLDQLTGRRR